DRSQKTSARKSRAMRTTPAASSSRAGSIGSTAGSRTEKKASSSACRRSRRRSPSRRRAGRASISRPMRKFLSELGAGERVLAPHHERCESWGHGSAFQGAPPLRARSSQAWRSPRNAAMVFPSMSEVLSRFSERVRAPHRPLIAFGGRDESRWRFTQAHDALVGDGGPDRLLL